MNLITKVNIPEFDFKINIRNNILFTGSCFAENIGNKFIENRFNTLVNPFGILYNPASIKSTLETAINNTTITNDNIIFHNNKWHSFLHHGKFSNKNKNLFSC